MSPISSSEWREGHIGRPSPFWRRELRWLRPAVNESTTQTTRILRRLRAGDDQAADQLLPLVYEELRSLAGRIVAERHKQTLQATELLHEAYLRLCGSDSEFEDKQHFLRVAARAMRYALVDHARERGAQKRGRSAAHITFDEELFEVAERADSVLAIDEALTALGETDARLAEIVQLKFFGGLTHDEVAATLDCSLRSVERGWRLARAWLVSRIESHGAR